MIDSIMSKKDLEKLDSLYEISETIKNIYKKLILLDINNKKNASRYEKLLGYLKEILIIEDSIYNSLNFDFAKCNLWASYIKEKKLSKFKSDDLLIDGNIDNFEYRRIFYMICYIRNLKINNMVDLSMLGIKIEHITMGNEEEANKKLNNYISGTSKLTNAYMKDYYSTMLLFLEESINKETNKDIKAKLIERKYYISYFYKDIEKEMISNNFILPNEIYSNSKMLMSIFNLNDDFQGDLFFSMSLVGLINSYFCIKIDNKDYVDKKTSMIIVENLLKSKIANISENYMKEFTTDLNKALDSLITIFEIKAEVKTIKDIVNNGPKYRNRIGKIEFGIRM